MRWHDLYARVRFPLMRESHNNGIPLHLDSLAHETAERTFTLIEKHTPCPAKASGYRCRAGGEGAWMTLKE